MGFLRTTYQGSFAGECSPNVILEQHFLNTPSILQEVLRTLQRQGRTVLEFGAGQGAITRLLLNEGVAEIHAFELDEALWPHLQLPRVIVHGGDLQQLRVLPEGVHPCSVSAPPYSCLPHLVHILDLHGVWDVVTFAPRSKVMDLLDAGFRVAQRISGSCFDPPSTGEHCILVRGFRETPSLS